MALDSNLYKLGILNQFSTYAVTDVTVGSIVKATAIISTATTGSTTLSVSDSNTFTRPAGSFITDGFVVGQLIIPSGFANAANNSLFELSVVNATTMDVVGSSLVTETGSGDEAMTGGAYVNRSGGNGSVYGAYKDLWERLHDGELGVLPPLTTVQIAALTGIDNGVQVIDITLGNIAIHIGGSPVSPGQGFGILNNIPTTLQTTDATQTTIKTITMPDDNSAMLITVWLTAVESDGSDRGAYIRTATCYRDGTGAKIQGSVVNQHHRTSDGSWVIALDTSGNDIRVRVTGAAGQTINWRCIVRQMFS